MKKLLLLILSLCACEPQENNLINGYIEGEYVYVSPASSGVLDEINVVKGQEIKSGNNLFAVDSDIWQTKLNKAQNDVQAAKEQLAQAEAVLTNAEKEFNRFAKLVKTNAVSQAAYDVKLANFDSAQAKVAELTVLIKNTEQNLLQLQKQYNQNIVSSKVNGLVNDVYFRLGEFVAQGTPVVSILPPENIKVRFFVSEKILPQIKYNQTVFVSYDGAMNEIKAKVSYISPSAEYTPPVIYSTESRDKLVFMIEAVFENMNDILNVGLPVSVRIE